MGLIDVVREAQARTSGEYKSVCAFPLEPSWLTSQNLIDRVSIGHDELTENTDTGYLIRKGTLPPVADSLKHRIEEEESLTKELIQKVEQGQVKSVATLEELVRPYLEKTVAVVVAAGAHSFVKLLKKAVPFLGRRLSYALLQACVLINFWDAVLLLLEQQLVSGYACPNLVAKLIESNQPSILCSWIRNVRDPRPSDLLLVLKFFLKAWQKLDKPFTLVRQQWRQKASAAIAKLSKRKPVEAVSNGTNGANYESHAKMEGKALLVTEDGMEKSVRDDLISNALLLSAAIDGFQPNDVCLHYLVASGQDEAVLASIVSQLDTNELLTLLRYLVRWLRKYSVLPIQYTFPNRKQGPWIPTFAQVLQWVTVLLDGHYTTFVLCSDFHSELKTLQGLIMESIDVGLKLSSLSGITDHIRSNAALPAQGSFGRDADHVIEYLEI